MEIKLTGIDTYYINMYRDTKREGSTKEVLKSCGFHSIRRSPGFKNKNNAIGCGMAHQNVLQSRIDKDSPFILFEDDIELTHFDNFIEIPDNADAIYLGISKMGMVDGTHKEELIVSKVEGYPHLVKIHNMLTSHAILYINNDYVKSLSNFIQYHIDHGIPVDIGMAEHMTEWNVYALDKPMFIQRDKFRSFTDTAISKLENVQYSN